MRVNLLRHLMRVWCGSTIVLAYCQYSCKHTTSDFWDYLYERTVNRARLSGKGQCIAKWLMFAAINERDPKKVCKVFETIYSLAPNMPIPKRHVISGVEAAIWEREPELVEKLLDKESRYSRPLGRMSHRRLKSPRRRPRAGPPRRRRGFRLWTRSRRRGRCRQEPWRRRSSSRR